MTEEAESLNRVMVIAAHPDDPEFGCGGTIAKWAAAGKEIRYVLLTSGDKGSHDPGAVLANWRPCAKTSNVQQRMSLA